MLLCCGGCSWEDEAALAALVAEVDATEAAGSVGPWPFEDAPASLLEELPMRGAVASRTDLPELGATELVLSNGMKARARSRRRRDLSPR